MKAQEFINYINDFYGKKGFFGDAFNHKLTKRQISNALKEWNKAFPSSPIDSREAFKAWMYKLYPQIANGECEYQYIGVLSDEDLLNGMK